MEKFAYQLYRLIGWNAGAINRAEMQIALNVEKQKTDDASNN